MKKRIGLIIAMQAEAQGIIEEMEFSPIPSPDPSLPAQFYQTRLNSGIEVVLAVNGVDTHHGVDLIGCEAATLTAYLMLHHFKPDLVLNAGTAGGFERRGAKIGEVMLVQEHVFFHDRRVPIPGFMEQGEGRFGVWEAKHLARELGVRTGVVSTGSSLELSPRDAEKLEEQKADLKEMEAAAIAWVCQLKKTPFLALKSVTDFVDHPEPAQDQFLKNLSLASANLTGILANLLNNISL